MDWWIWPLIALAVGAILFRHWPGLRRQWTVDRGGFLRTLVVIPGYVAFCTVGFGILLLALGREPRAPAMLPWAMAFLFGWIALGTLMLLKLTPRYRTLPAWLVRPVNALDLAVAAVVIAALVALFA